MTWWKVGPGGCAGQGSGGRGGSRGVTSDIFLDVINLFCESLNFYLKTLNLENFFSIIEYLRVFFGMKYFHSLKIFLGKKKIVRSKLSRKIKFEYLLVI